MIAISSCVAGEACRFDGTNQDLEKALMLVKYGSTIKVCPEVLGGLPIPRPSAEIQMINKQRKVMTKAHDDVTGEFELGAAKTLELCQMNNINYVILKDRSPSCGKGFIYNGNFEGKLIKGNGLTSDLLLQHNIKVFNTSNAPYEKLMVYDFLEENGITYEKFQHEPVFNVEEADQIQIDMNAQQCKNLFLESKNKKDKVLVILPAKEQIKIKEIENLIGIKKLRFASKESLKKSLGVEPGSVGAFGLLYDTENEVKVVISNSFIEHERMTFHPNINDETLSLEYNDFMKVIKNLGYNPLIINIDK